MPFDGLPEGLVSDLVKLRIALDGVRGGWTRCTLGRRASGEHCALGWLLEATDYDRDETVRLALEYVYPALPQQARKEHRLESIYMYNDHGGPKRIQKLFADAVKLAERRIVP